jgi:hypothetical protein
LTNFISSWFIDFFKIILFLLVFQYFCKFVLCLF